MWKNNTIYTCCKCFPSTFTSTNNKIINLHKGAGRSVRYSTHRTRGKSIVVEDTLGNIITSLYRKSQILNNFLQLVMSPTPVSGTLEASNNVNQESLESVEAKKMKIETLKGDKENQDPPPAVLRFVKMTEFAHNPTRGSKFAAGYDLKSAYKATVPARGSFMVKTDIQIQLPSGTYGRVAPRSGLALKHQIDVGAGVIDEDYRGNVGVILFNHSDTDFIIVEGDRIAQLICEKIVSPEAVEVKSLDESERGGSGFGSTGTNN